MTVDDVPIVRGMFDVNIGPIDLPFDEQYWLEIVVDGNTLAPRVQLTSSPYAFRAAVADSFTGGISPWTQDTMIAHWDSVRAIPADIADGDDPGFQQLRANGSAWLTDSVTFVEGSNITLTQTGDTIEIASTGGGGGANGWVDDGTVVRLETSTDKVGIGTTTPSDKLEVHDGSLFIEGSDNGAIRIGQGSDFYQMIIDYDANDEGSALYFQAYGTDRIYFSTNGKQGIGTTSPGARLDITATDVDGRALYVHGASPSDEPDTGIVIRNISSHGIFIESPVMDGVNINSPYNDGVEISGGTSTERGLYIHDASGTGDPDTGIVVRNVGYDGIYIDEPGSHGIFIDQPVGKGLGIYSPGSFGLDIGFAADDGIRVTSPDGDGLEIEGGPFTERGIYIHDNLSGVNPDTGIVIWNVAHDGISIGNPGEDGVENMGGTTTGRGIYVHDYSDIGDPDTGIVIRDVANHGIYIDGPGNDGVNIDNARDDGLEINYASENGIRIDSPDNHGIFINSPGVNGVHVQSPEGRGIVIYQSGSDGMKITQPGGNGVEVAGGSLTSRGLFIHDETGTGDPDTGIVIRDVAHHGIYIDEPGSDGLNINNPGRYGTYIIGPEIDGLRIAYPGADGISIYDAPENGIEIAGGTDNKRGIYIYDTFLSGDPDTGIVIEETQTGIYVNNPSCNGLLIDDAGCYGVRIENPYLGGVLINDSGANGIQINNSLSYGIYVSTSNFDGVYITDSDNYDGYFNDDIYAATGSFGIKPFLIDHPSDPEHKLLRHYSTESPEVLVTYRGKVELDGSGQGIISMPDYFPDLTDEDGVTVHLTPIGREPFLISYEWDAQNCEVHVYGKPNGEASYQVNAERDDPVKRYLVQPVESNKADGKYCPDGELLIPEAYGYPESRRRHYKLHQEALEQREEKK